MNDSLENETVKKIYDLIEQNPGLHLSKIAEHLHMSIPLADYHLLQLEKNKDIVAVKDSSGHFKRYYAAESGIETQDKKVLEHLQKKIPLVIVLFLLRQPTL